MKRALIAGLIMLTAGVVAAQDSEGSRAWLNLSGFYAFNGYSQNNFFLGKGAVGGVSDKDEYSIQLFRLAMDFGYGDNVKAVIRADLAQGIWGIDNSQRDNWRGGFSNLFNNKDTNFEFHVDWAYVDFTYPEWGFNAKLGRQHFVLGNKLVLDQDNDGIAITQETGPGKLLFTWSKMSEGQDSLSDAEDPTGAKDYGDADLYTLGYAAKAGSWTLNPYLAYYHDQGTSDGTAYIPQGFQYFVARFQPQITKAQVYGLAFNGTAGPVTVKGEVDYLVGDDDIANVDSGPNEILDVNNGDLSGYNLYLDGRLNAGPGTFGFVFGYGSGDDDPMSGDGNINKIRTNGYFYITEVWEDSVMPDEGGITPQGLGSPASRGYREFENSTLFQLSYLWRINERFSLFASGTYVQATEAIFEWADSNGDGAIQPEEMGPNSSSDLGQEIDLKLDWKVTPGLVWIFRGGIFYPGDGAGYLINGTNAFDKNAYELRTTIKYSFGGIGVGR